jgi:hypothetical protein
MARRMHTSSQKQEGPGAKIEGQEQHMASKKKTTKRLKKSKKLHPTKPLTVSLNFTKVE